VKYELLVLDTVFHSVWNINNSTKALFLNVHVQTNTFKVDFCHLRMTIYSFSNDRK
jgi:hypothetical protein